MDGHRNNFKIRDLPLILQLHSATPMLSLSIQWWAIDGFGCQAGSDSVLHWQGHCCESQNY